MGQGEVVGVLGVGYRKSADTLGLNPNNLVVFAEDSEQQLRLSLVKEKQIDK